MNLHLICLVLNLQGSLTSESEWLSSEAQASVDSFEELSDTELLLLEEETELSLDVSALSLCSFALPTLGSLGKAKEQPYHSTTWATTSGVNFAISRKQSFWRILLRVRRSNMKRPK